MPGKLVDMQIAYNVDSAKLAHSVYNTLPAVLKRRLTVYEELLQMVKHDKQAYLKVTREPPTALRDRRDDVNRYMDEVHGLGFDDFCEVDKKTFGNREVKPKLGNVRGRDVYFLAAFKDYEGKDSPNDGYMKTFLVLDALKRASAKGRIIVAPYMPYERQDRKDESRVPISFKAIADLLTTVGMTRLLTMDLHAPQEQGFFDIPVDDLPSVTLFLPVIEEIKHSCKNVVIVNPDAGSAKRNEYLMKVARLPSVIIDKTREEYEAQIREAPGLAAVRGSIALCVDDIYGSGKTLLQTAERAKTFEPIEVISLATHLIGNLLCCIINSSLDYGCSEHGFLHHAF